MIDVGSVNNRNQVITKTAVTAAGGALVGAVGEYICEKKILANARAYQDTYLNRLQDLINQKPTSRFGKFMVEKLKLITIKMIKAVNALAERGKVSPKMILNSAGIFAGVAAAGYLAVKGVKALFSKKTQA